MMCALCALFRFTAAERYNAGTTGELRQRERGWVENPCNSVLVYCHTLKTKREMSA